MYEKFTDRSRKVMSIANQEAQRYNHEWVGPEHILLGLAVEGSGVAANVLMASGVTIIRLRTQIEQLAESGPDLITTGRLPHTPRAKRVMEHAISEAHDLGHGYVGTEHLLLGLLQVKEGVAHQVLVNMGIKESDIRKGVLKLIGRYKKEIGFNDFVKSWNDVTKEIYRLGLSGFEYHILSDEKESDFCGTELYLAYDVIRIMHYAKSHGYKVAEAIAFSMERNENKENEREIKRLERIKKEREEE